MLNFKVVGQRLQLIEDAEQPFDGLVVSGSVKQYQCKF